MLVTLGLSFMVADLCLMEWTGDPISVATPAGLARHAPIFGVWPFPLYRLAIIVDRGGGRGRRCGCCSTARDWAR